MPEEKGKESARCRTADVAPAIGLPGFVSDGQEVWVRFCDPEYGKADVIPEGADA